MANGRPEDTTPRHKRRQSEEKTPKSRFLPPVFRKTKIHRQRNLLDIQACKKKHRKHAHAIGSSHEHVPIWSYRISSAKHPRIVQICRKVRTPFSLFFERWKRLALLKTKPILKLNEGPFLILAGFSTASSEISPLNAPIIAPNSMIMTVNGVPSFPVFAIW